MDIVVYYRRREAGKKNYGLDLEAQRQSVADWVDQRGANIVAQFTEIEAGENIARPKLAQAIAKVNASAHLLLVATGHRMKVNVRFLTHLQHVPFAVANDDELTSATLPRFLNKAREWANNQSLASREGAKGAVCGAARPGHWNRRNKKLLKQALEKATEASVSARKERARAAYALILPLMKKWKAKEGVSFNDVATRLNDDGYLTTAGKPFTASAVHRIMRDFG